MDKHEMENPSRQRYIRSSTPIWRGTTSKTIFLTPTCRTFKLPPLNQGIFLLSCTVVGLCLDFHHTAIGQHTQPVGCKSKLLHYFLRVIGYTNPGDIPVEHVQHFSFFPLGKGSVYQSHPFLSSHFFQLAGILDHPSIPVFHRGVFAAGRLSDPAAPCASHKAALTGRRPPGRDHAHDRRQGAAAAPLDDRRHFWLCFRHLQHPQSQIPLQHPYGALPAVAHLGKIAVLV